MNDLQVNRVDLGKRSHQNRKLIKIISHVQNTFWSSGNWSDPMNKGHSIEFGHVYRRKERPIIIYFIASFINLMQPCLFRVRKRKLLLPFGLAYDRLAPPLANILVSNRRKVIGCSNNCPYHPGSFQVERNIGCYCCGPIDANSFHIHRK